MVGSSGAFPVNTLSRSIPAELDAVIPRNTMSILHGHGRSTRITRHESDDTHAGVNRQ